MKQFLYRVDNDRIIHCDETESVSAEGLMNEHDIIITLASLTASRKKLPFI
jgi:hypothetical protein